MPVVLRYKGYRFYFYSNEGDSLEPLHIYVRRGEDSAKFRLEPAVHLVVSFDEDNLWVELENGHKVGIPPAYFPRLLKAPTQQRSQFILSGGGRRLHWEEINEDISARGLLSGIGDRTHRRS